MDKLEFSSNDAGDSLSSFLSSAFQGKQEESSTPPVETPKKDASASVKVESKKEEVVVKPVEEHIEEVVEDEQATKSEEPSKETEEQENEQVSPELAKYKKDADNFQKGMRKFQRERDELLKQSKESAKTLKKYEDLVNSFKKGGIEDLVNALAEKEGAWSEIQKRIEERAIRRHEADPSEIELLNREEELIREKRKREQAEKDYQEHLDRIKAKEVKAQEAELRSKVNPAFDKVRFDGKLGDSGDEADANDMVWSMAIEDLKKYATENDLEDHEIPNSVIEQAFTRRARLVSKGSEKQVKEVLEKKKEEATKKAQLKSTAKTSTTKTVDEVAEDYMKDYNLKGFLNSIFN